MGEDIDKVFMVLTTALIVGGIAVAHRKIVPADNRTNPLMAWRSTLQRRLQPLGRNKRKAQLAALLSDADDVTITAAERRLNRELVFASSSLAVTVLGTLFYPPLRLLSLPSVIYSLFPIYRDAYQSIRSKQFDVDVLYAVTQSLVVGRGYLLPANLGALYYFLSRKLLVMAESRFEVQLHEIFGQLPSTVHKVIDGIEVPCALTEVAAGDLIAVHAGETIPVDGIVIGGMAMVDQRRLTGEAQPVEKGEGTAVYAATLIQSGTLQIQVAEAGASTIVAQIGAILTQTTAHTADRALWAKRFNDRLVWPVVALGGLSVPIVGLDGAQAIIDSHPQRRMNISSALSALNFLGVAADAGILVKDGRALELLQRIDTIVFDKTGTLTLDEPHVAQIHPATGFNAETVLRYAAAAEVYQEHPIAQAILQAAQDAALSFPALDEATYHVGYGLAAQIGAERIYVGSERWLAREGITLPSELEAQLAAIWERGDSGVLVAVDGQVAGLIELHATLRPEAAAIIEMVHRRGVEITILSGDQEAPTRHLAKALGIEHYVAGVLPEEKAAFVARLQAEGKHVGFIGDGINDAIAMKQADVAISLQGATTAATDTAHIVLMNADLQQLAVLYALAERYSANRHATVGVFIAGTTIAISGAYFLGFGLWHVATLNMITFPLSLGVAMWPQIRQAAIGE